MDKLSTEYKIQLDKLQNYKGESLDTLKYKIQLEKLLETDQSFISAQEKQDLDQTAHKKAEQILNKAIDNYKEPEKKKNISKSTQKSGNPLQIIPPKHLQDDVLVI